MNMMITKWGNSLGVRIPGVIAKEAGLGVGSAVRVTVRNGRVVLEPTRYDLDSLVKDITPQNCHAATDTGAPVGQEIW